VHPSTSPSSSSAPPRDRAFFEVPGTFFPHVLIDEVLPTLSGSQWQLLTVIVRQTLGWHDPSTGGRKASDWLSHRQLKARTGRGSDAVCSAIDSLVRRDLIAVTDEAGRLLATPAERRRARRLFYALSPRLLARLQEAEPSKPELSEKPKVTAAATRKSRTEVPQTIRTSRFRKPETTKETDTKYINGALGKAEWQQPSKIQTPFKVARPEDDGCGCLRPLSPPPLLPYAGGTASPATEPVPLGPELRAFLDFYQQKLSDHQGHPSEPTTPSLIDQAQLQAASERFGMKRLEQLAEVFLESDSRILHRRGYGLGVFLEVLPTLSVLRLKPSPLAAWQVLAAEPSAAAWAPRREE